MKRFTFRLQRLLDVRAKQQELLRQRLVALQASRADVEAALAGARQGLTRTLRQLARLRRRGDWRREELVRTHVGNVSARIDRLEAALLELEGRRERMHREWEEARAARRMLEELRRRRAAEHELEMSRLEQAFLDETALKKFVVRSQAATG